MVLFFLLWSVDGLISQREWLAAVGLCVCSPCGCADCGDGDDGGGDAGRRRVPPSCCYPNPSTVADPPLLPLAAAGIPLAGKLMRSMTAHVVVAAVVPR